MPRARVSDIYRHHAFLIWGEEPRASARSVAEKLDRLALEAGKDDAPSERTISRWRDEFRSLSEQEQQQYHDARWPESMEMGALPWEASGVFMEVAGKYLEKGVRPKVLLIKWLWRITQAIPTAPLYFRLKLAIPMSFSESVGYNSTALLRSIEAVMSFPSWTPEGYKAYNRLIGEGLISKFNMLEPYINATNDRPFFESWAQNSASFISDLEIHGTIGFDLYDRLAEERNNDKAGE